MALGPLTNIALATILDEQFLSNIKEIIIMGGSFTGIFFIKYAWDFNVILIVMLYNSYLLQ